MHHMSYLDLEWCGIDIEVALLLATDTINVFLLFYKNICYLAKDSFENHFDTYFHDAWIHQSDWYEFEIRGATRHQLRKVHIF